MLESCSPIGGANNDGKMTRTLTSSVDKPMMDS